MKLLPSVPDILYSDHGELDTLLHATLEALDAGDVARTFEELDFFWARLAMHIRAEHLRLFPVVREVAERSAELTDIPLLLDGLREDHDFFMRGLARAIKALRLVFHFGNEEETFAIVRDLIGEIAARLKIHNQIEEERIYPLAAENCLDTASANELASSVAAELDKYPNRFAGRAPVK